jgi:asparagine N-glycosylation enzyme membrane subunit Stt3
MLSADSSVNKWKPAIRITILLLICSVATLVRIFSVIRYESIIHEFDPWFNFRATKFLVNNNFKEFWNFFDSESWYPLGRNVGATVYPGLMVPIHSSSPPAASSISSSTSLPSPSIFEISVSSSPPSSLV